MRFLFRVPLQAVQLDGRKVVPIEGTLDEAALQRLAVIVRLQGEAAVIERDKVKVFVLRQLFGIAVVQKVEGADVCVPSGAGIDITVK